MSTTTPTAEEPATTKFVRKEPRDFAEHLKSSAILALIEHHGGPTATAARINELRMPGSKRTPTQRVGSWRVRGWASPMAFHELGRMLPPGMTVDDLFADRLLAEKLGEKVTAAA